MDTRLAAIKEQLGEVRALTEAAQQDEDMRSVLLTRIGELGQHISNYLDEWLALEDEANELFEIISGFYEQQEMAQPAEEETEDSFSNWFESEVDASLDESLRKGMAYFDLWLFSQASEILSAVTIIEPNNHVAKLFLAASETARGQFENALPLLSELLDASSDELLICAAFEIAAQGHFARNQLGDAVTCLQEVVARMPDYPDTWYNLGVCFSRQLDFTSAAGALCQALELNPDDVEARSLLADVYHRVGELDAAADVLMDGLERMPLQLGLVLKMAKTRSKQERFAESIRWYRRAIQLNPMETCVWTGYAGILLRLGKRNQAIAALKKHLSLSPNDADGTAQLAVLQSLRGDTMTEPLLQLLDGSPHRSIWHLAKGRLAYQQGRNQQAFQDFDDAMKQSSHPAVQRLAEHYKERIHDQMRELD